MIKLAQKLGLELLFLPPYSPNLNLIERLWKLVKSRCLRNRYFPEFSLFRAGIDEFLDSLQGERKALLSSLITESFQLIRNPKS